jgi:hypothetical protein
LSAYAPFNKSKSIDDFEFGAPASFNTPAIGSFYKLPAAACQYSGCTRCPLTRLPVKNFTFFFDRLNGLNPLNTRPK